MNRFRFSKSALDIAGLRAEVASIHCGGYAAFEGWVRDHNEGRQVTALEYEAFEPLGVTEGERIIAEATARYGVTQLLCVHRLGSLVLGDVAVWVGAAAPHRDEAFKACRYVIDEVKHRVPIWKKEHYAGGDSGWVNCERCAADAHRHDRPRDTTHDPASAHPHAPAHGHTHD